MCIATTVSEMLAQNVALDLAILDLRLADGSSPKSNVEQLRAAGLETLIFTGAENPYLVRSAPVPAYWVLYASPNRLPSWLMLFAPPRREGRW